MACLDTTTLLDLRGRGGRRLRTRAEEKVRQLLRAGEELTTTIFNVAELWVGIERSDDPAEEQGIVEKVLSPLVVLGFDPRAAQTFGRITAHLEALGQAIGDMDALIASVATVNGERIITRNTAHFERVTGLRVETY